MEITADGSTRAASDRLDSTSPIRIRISRWKIDDHAIQYIRASASEKVQSRVVVDKILYPSISENITEADILTSAAHDIDWEYFYGDIATNEIVTHLFHLPIVKAEYLVLLGYGAYTDWDSKYDTNKWLWASQHVITRFYGKDRVNPMPAPLSFAHGESPTFEWSLDCPEREAYTACRVRLHGGGAVVRETNIMRMPPNRNAAAPRYGRYRWTPPVDWLADITNAATWSVEAYNSKFRSESAVTNTAAIIYSP